MPAPRALLVGRDDRRALAGLGLAAAVAVLFGAGPLALETVGVVLPSTYYFQGVLGIALAAATVTAYYNDGLVVCWLVAGAGLAPFALSFALADAPLGRDPTVLGGLATLAGSAGLFGVVVGTAGFAVGAGGRRIVARYRDRSRPVAAD